MIKYLQYIFLAGFLFACSDKNEDDCYECVITWFITASVPVEGYPATTTTTYELCKVTTEEVELFEQTNRGSETNVVGNITYSSNHSTKCTYK